MTSHKSNTSARPPQRQRGVERVASLLDAAASCFAEQGVEATTMTAVAARAGAAIGSLYQFFPTKQALVQALLEQFSAQLYAQLDQLVDKAPELDDAALALALSQLLVRFRRQHPAFVALAEAVPLADGGASEVRRHLRSRLASLLRARIPALDPARAQAAAVVLLQWMKAAVALAAESGLRGRQAALNELQLAMQGYLGQLARAD